MTYSTPTRDLITCLRYLIKSPDLISWYQDHLPEDLQRLAYDSHCGLTIYNLIGDCEKLITQLVDVDDERREMIREIVLAQGETIYFG